MNNICFDIIIQNKKGNTMRPKNAIDQLAYEIEKGYKHLKEDPKYLGNDTSGAWVFVYDNDDFCACALSCAAHTITNKKGDSLRDYMMNEGLENHSTKGIHIQENILRLCLKKDEWDEYKKTSNPSWDQTLHGIVIKLNDNCKINPIRIAEILREIAKIVA